MLSNDLDSAVKFSGGTSGADIKKKKQKQTTTTKYFQSLAICNMPHLVLAQVKLEVLNFEMQPPFATLSFSQLYAFSK